MQPTVEERFWAKVDKSAGADGCWMWTGNREKKGYGHFTIGQKVVKAHRFSWLTQRGEIPEGLLVLHRCDVRACVNPAHLWLGTNGDNMADMRQKGRAASGDQSPRRLNRDRYAAIARGEQSGRSKLRADQVREIRKRHAAGEAIRALKREFGMSQWCIQAIVRRITWKHLGERPEDDVLPVAVVKEKKRKKPVEERFWEKVSVRGADECWTWTGAQSKGYGQFKIDGAQMAAHRVAWVLKRGPIPAGLDVLHACDNRRCVNPNHLSVGTCQENTDDKMAKGRHRVGDKRGRLTPALAEEVRSRYQESGVTQMELAAEYGVTQPTIARILAGKNWPRQ